MNHLNSLKVTPSQVYPEIHMGQPPDMMELEIGAAIQEEPQNYMFN